MIGLLLATTLLFGGTVFYLVAWTQAWRVESAKTELERRRERINSEIVKLQKSEQGKWLVRKLDSWGWRGDVTPLLLMAGVLYLLTVTIFSAIGLGGFAGAVIALPGSLCIVGLVNSSNRSKKRKMFNKQLMQALDLFAAQLKSGLSSVRAMEQVLPSLPQPLRGELAVALERYRTGALLGDSLAEVYDLYPSRAMQMLVVSVRIDEERGGRMADALEQAAENVRRDFELGAEAQAELSQERGQFYGIVGILGFFTYFTIGRADPAAREAYMTMPGLGVIAVAIGNAVFGIIRTLRVFAKAKGDL